MEQMGNISSSMGDISWNGGTPNSWMVFVTESAMISLWLSGL